VTEAAGLPPRWDPDDRGIGVGDARSHLATLDALRDVAGRDAWVAESPEAHLLPRLAERASGISPFRIEATRTEPDGTFEVDARWVGPREPEQWQVRAAAIAIIGVVAEATTVVHETRGPAGDPVFDVVTGLLPGETAFATHGHTLRLRVLGSARAPSDIPDPDA
jgi:hypothetical protein